VEKKAVLLLQRWHAELKTGTGHGLAGWLAGFWGMPRSEKSGSRLFGQWAPRVLSADSSVFGASAQAGGIFSVCQRKKRRTL